MSRALLSSKRGEEGYCTASRAHIGSPSAWLVPAWQTVFRVFCCAEIGWSESETVACGYRQGPKWVNFDSETFQRTRSPGLANAAIVSEGTDCLYSLWSQSVAIVQAQTSIRASHVYLMHCQTQTPHKTSKKEPSRFACGPLLAEKERIGSRSAIGCAVI